MVVLQRPMVHKRHAFDKCYIRDFHKYSDMFFGVVDLLVFVCKNVCWGRVADVLGRLCVQ